MIILAFPVVIKKTCVIIYNHTYKSIIVQGKVILQRTFYREDSHDAYRVE